MERTPLFKDFNYGIPKPFNKIQILKRRLLQLRQLLFSKKIKSPDDLQTLIQAHYSHPGEIDFYRPYAQFGFHQNEAEAFARSGVGDGQVLVVGCGTGREVFALSEIGNFKKIHGIDFSEAMIAEAQTLNTHKSVQFSTTSIHDLKEKFNLIWITALLESHIQGSKNRIHFFRTVFGLCDDSTAVIVTPHFKQMSWKHPHFWSSHLLRLRWRKHWEPGDVLLSHLEAHRITNQMIYSHFYPSRKHLINELNQAGFMGTQELAGHSWLIKKMAPTHTDHDLTVHSSSP